MIHGFHILMINLLLWKSSELVENHNTIVFADRDINKIIIPKYIKYIASYKFYECDKLNEFEIPTDSDFQTIGKYSFSRTRIASFTVPRHVTLIDDGEFYFNEWLCKF